MSPAAKTVEQQLKEYTDKSSGPEDCWEWTVAKNNMGYGTVRVKTKAWLAHRLWFQYVNGPIPEELEVCHSCDNPACVNPFHLWLGTHTENLRDAVEKGRIRTGEAALGAKLRQQEGNEIRRLVGGGLSQSRAGQRFGVAQSTVENIILGRTWKDRFNG